MRIRQSNAASCHENRYSDSRNRATISEKKNRATPTNKQHICAKGTHLIKADLEEKRSTSWRATASPTANAGTPYALCRITPNYAEQKRDPN
jgi:hypothetical protein